MIFHRHRARRGGLQDWHVWIISGLLMLAGLLAFMTSLGAFDRHLTPAPTTSQLPTS